MDFIPADFIPDEIKDDALLKALDEADNAALFARDLLIDVCGSGPNKHPDPNADYYPDYFSKLSLLCEAVETVKAFTMAAEALYISRNDTDRTGPKITEADALEGVKKADDRYTGLYLNVAKYNEETGDSFGKY